MLVLEINTIIILHVWILFKDIIKQTIQIIKFKIDQLTI